MPSRKLPPNEEVVALYRSGLSTGEIAERFGVAPITVISLFRRIGEPRRSLKEAAQQAVRNGRYHGNTFWVGKTQPPDMVEKRVSKIRGDKHWNWKGGGDTRAYRKKVKKEACARCGTTERLAIHHEDHDHFNDEVTNLTVLCVSCHASVHKKAYWDAIHAGEQPKRGNAPIGWGREVMNGSD